MPIMAAHSRSDARGATRLLANAAKYCISDPTIGPSRQITLNNVFRLLEAFRSSVLFGRDFSEDHESDANGGALTMGAPHEHHIEDVRDAISSAVRASFADQDDDHAIETIEKVLRAIAYPERSEHPTAGELRDTTSFFDRLLDNLEVK